MLLQILEEDETGKASPIFHLKTDLFRVQLNVRIYKIANIL